MEPRIVDDHGTNNNDYFISINPRKLNSSGIGTKGRFYSPVRPLVTPPPIGVDLKLRLIMYRVYIAAFAIYPL